MDKTPKHHGEFYFEPDAAQWRNAVLQNREIFSKMTLWGQNISKVRTFLKIPVDCPVVLTGHQPVFFYPGIWAKCLAASQLAQLVGGAAYHKITDTALAPEFTHFIPEVDKKAGARRVEVDLFASKELKNKEKSIPYAFMPAPDRTALKKILSDVISFGPTSSQRAAFHFNEKLVNGLKVDTNWNQFHVYILDLLDQITGDKRTILEGRALWASEPFLNFLIYWFIHMADLNKDYNDSLDEYRKKKGITHEIEPMPNLKFEDWYFELPFWGTTKAHHRDTVWAKTDGKMLSLRVKGSEGGHYTFHLDDLKNGLSASSLKIWPKAIPQTLFCRMYLCDFFIHGIGGGIYEEVGDLFFKKTTQVDPPAYGIVSATYWADFEENEELNATIDEKKALEFWNRTLEQNPEYLFTRQTDWKRDLSPTLQLGFECCLKDETLKKLADEKKELLSWLKDPAKKLQASRRIKELNGELVAGFREVLKSIKEELLKVQMADETQKVLTFREYPFFCFEEPVFLDMKEKIRRAFAGGVK